MKPITIRSVIINFLFTAVLVFILPHFSLAQVGGAGDEQALSQKLEKIIAASQLNKNDLALAVFNESSPSSQQVLLVNGEKKMVPASLTKILTAGAVLKFLPPNFEFKTKLLSAASINKQNLSGDLHLVGGGDPAFVSEDMWVLVNQLTRLNVREIEGDVVVDDRLYDGPAFDESRESRRVDRAYDAPIGAMSFNWNCVNIYVRPGASAGEAAQVVADPDNNYIKIINKTKTVKGSKGAKIEGGHSLSISRQASADHDQITVSGGIPQNSKELVFFKSITRPALWSGANLVSFLHQRGISVRGRVRRGEAPAAARVLAEHASKPLSKIVADMAKFSNNFVAEMLTLALSSLSGDRPWRMEAGVERIRQFLEEVGVPRGRYELANPSGFSHQNAISAADLRLVLSYLRRRFNLFPEFLSALPVAGVDGTLQKRFNNGNGQWVRAKTGLLDGVVGLAGFAGRPDGKLFSFVFIYNGKADGGKVRASFDRLASQIASSEN